jgi:hypothetical protein
MIALQTFINSLGQFIDNQVATSLTTVGAVRPYVVAELPAVTFSLGDLSCGTVGVGGNPSNLITGALQVELNLDLADPVITFPGNDTVNLLAADRLSLQMPHSPLVDRDGATPEFLSAADLTVTRNETPFSVVQTLPGAGQCRLGTAGGLLEFGGPLPATGNLVVRYHIGQWEAETTRCTGLLQVDIFSTGATNTERLSNEVSLALASNPRTIAKGLTRLTPVSWGAIERPDAPRGNTMARTLQYGFTFDHEQPIISTGGGPIRIIDVWSGMGPEQFFITKRDNHE